MERENFRNVRERCTLRRDIIREFLAELLGTFVLIVSLLSVRTSEPSKLRLTILRFQCIRIMMNIASFVSFYFQLSYLILVIWVVLMLIFFSF